MKGYQGDHSSTDRRQQAAAEAAQAIALQALGFLAGDEERLGQFLAITGLGPENLRSAAAEPGFLAGVLRHICEDEALLLAMAANTGLRPEDIGKAGATLGGGDENWAG